MTWKKFIDRTGMKYGRLTAIKRAPDYEYFSKVHNRFQYQTRWHCICDCGKESTVLTCQLVTKSTRSCGCILNEWRISNGAVLGKKYGAENGRKSIEKNRLKRQKKD